MYPPRPSFNGLFVTALLGMVAFCGNAHGQAPAAPAAPADPTASVPDRPIGLSAAFEPYYKQLFEEVKMDYPADLVPPLTLARERLLDKSTKVDAQKKAVYDIGLKLLDNMKVVAEERSQALIGLLKAAARPTSSLDTAKSTASTNEHFLNLQLQRANDGLKRRKPAVDAMFAQLKTAEQTWNARFPEGTRAENYNFKGLSSPIITKEAGYPWRTNYYQRYGLPKSN